MCISFTMSCPLLNDFMLSALMLNKAKSALKFGIWSYGYDISQTVNQLTIAIYSIYILLRSHFSTKQHIIAYLTNFHTLWMGEKKHKPRPLENSKASLEDWYDV